MDFYTAYHYLNNHPIFKGEFDESLDIMVVRVDPFTRCVEDDRTRNTTTNVWLECGPMSEEYDPKHPYQFPKWEHDLDLDCGGDTFEAAIIQLAKLVEAKYGNKNDPQ